ncbi:MAG: glycosyltransferase family 2 protein, partial [Candidatus Omnitrophica bacterium]|nr:glycosyltransferase family 2 protein [Candidatus Omnitrophota bacterium]
MNTADSKYRSLNKSISIVMPAYNEEQNIEKTVKKCAHLLDSLAVKGEVVVTDDGSVDRTKEILSGLKGKMANLVVVEHKENKGYGASLNDAIIASKGDLIVSIDSDGQFDIDELPLLLDRYMEGHPIVAGFRKEKKDSFFKVFADRCMNLMVNMMFGLRLRDSNCAFKLYERDIIKPVKVESMGFSAPTEIMVKLK